MKSLSIIQMASTSRQETTDPQKYMKTMSPMFTPPLTTPSSTRTCWQKVQKLASMEKQANLLQGTQTLKSHCSHLKRLLRFPPGLRAKSKTWWTIRFTSLRTKVRMNSPQIWGLGWSQREGTEQEIGFSFLILHLTHLNFVIFIPWHLCDCLLFSHTRHLFFFFLLSAAFALKWGTKNSRIQTCLQLLKRFILDLILKASLHHSLYL